MAGSLEGKKAVVTGASSGIGEATVEALVGEGAAVSAGARRRDRLEALAERVDGIVHAHEVDITDEAAARSFIEDSAAALDGLDILVNNAGVMLLGPVAGADVEHWQRMINVNLLGLLYCTHATLPIMGAAGSGHIVNVSSVAGRQASLGSAVYNMTKFGVNGFTEALRQEVTKKHVRVGVLEPGAVATELVSHNNEQIQADLASDADRIPEPLEPEDIADGITYMVTRPRRSSVAELWAMPTSQV